MLSPSVTYEAEALFGSCQPATSLEAEAGHALTAVMEPAAELSQAVGNKPAARFGTCSGTGTSCK
jgi:hypothetical protein